MVETAENGNQGGAWGGAEQGGKQRANLVVGSEVGRSELAGDSE
jgi:hypothetical protein